MMGGPAPGSAVIVGAGHAGLTRDNSSIDTDAGVLTGFVLGCDAREWGRRPAEERGKATLEYFVHIIREYLPQGTITRGYTHRG